MLEHFYPCPYCGETISSLLDSSVMAQTYIEDCEVCCRPLELEVEFADDELVHFSARHTG